MRSLFNGEEVKILSISSPDQQQTISASFFLVEWTILGFDEGPSAV
jgi:hypothetical protein